MKNIFILLLIVSFSSCQKKADIKNLQHSNFQCHDTVVFNPNVEQGVFNGLLESINIPETSKLPDGSKICESGKLVVLDGKNNHITFELPCQTDFKNIKSGKCITIEFWTEIHTEEGVEDGRTFIATKITNK